MNQLRSILSSFPLALIFACGGSDEEDAAALPLAVDEAREVPVDRFADGAMLQKRADNPALPGPNEPVDFDRAPFITRGLGPEGSSVRYYNFDVQPDQPASLYVLMRAGETTPVQGQLDVIDSLPGMQGYSDFLSVSRVTVPANYTANEVTSRADIEARGYGVEPTDIVVNRPVVPRGSTATHRLGSARVEPARAWYRGGVVYYFSFDEAELTGPTVPVAPIYVSFNLNPNVEGGGPASGFRHEPDSDQTHNVLTALPGDPGYSPLWSVSVYDQAAFENVTDLDSLRPLDLLATDVATVNCPVVELSE